MWASSIAVETLACRARRSAALQAALFFCLHAAERLYGCFYEVHVSSPEPEKKILSCRAATITLPPPPSRPILRATPLQTPTKPYETYTTRLTVVVFFIVLVFRSSCPGRVGGFSLVPLYCSLRIVLVRRQVIRFLLYTVYPRWKCW